MGYFNFFFFPSEESYGILNSPSIKYGALLTTLPWFIFDFAPAHNLKHEFKLDLWIGLDWTGLKWFSLRIRCCIFFFLPVKICAEELWNSEAYVLFFIWFNACLDWRKIDWEFADALTIQNILHVNLWLKYRWFTEVIK